MSDVTLRELSRVFGRIGVLSFGGPAAQIALMHRVLVDDRAWLTEREYLGALSFCMLLPGPEAMQLATYAGWKLRGVRGGLIAGLLFVMPGAAVVLALSALYAFLGEVPLVRALFSGIQAAVVVIVIEALLRVSRRALRRPSDWALAGLAFVAIFALGLPFPAIVLAAGLAGAALAHPAPPAEIERPVPRRATIGATLATAAVWGAVWLLPLAMLTATGGLLAELGLFFSKLAVVTFGGAYAVLAYMAQEVVGLRGWLTTAQMVDGLGLAETTPGPLILVTEFVGFMAGFGAGGVPLALAGAAVTLWMTFAPCFLWIFAGAPWMGAILARPRLASALAGVTAAVVGVILNLSLWFAVHVFFGAVAQFEAGPVRMVVPRPDSAEPGAFAIAAIAAVLLFRLHLGIGWVLAVSAVLGLAFAAVP